MSEYKVPQDVEAEDKLLGPFTFRQFIFLIIAAMSGAAMFFLSQISIVLIVLPMPFFLVFGFLGVYRRADQPVEVYLVALLRFYLKPRRRIWDQYGLHEAIKITAPKVEPHQFTDNLTEGEVVGRLQQLAGVMDTRGWSTKNSNLQVPATATPQVRQSDRLVAPVVAQAAEIAEVHESDDILDPYNRVSQDYSNMAQKAANDIRSRALQKMQATPTPQPQVSAPAAASAAPAQTQAATAPTNPPLIKQTVVQPLPVNQAQPAQNLKDTSTMTQEVQADIIRLSRNDDFSISSIANQAEDVLHDEDTVNLH